MDISANDILDFWYSDRITKSWFASTPEIDNEMLEKYELVWERAIRGELDSWYEEPEGALALVIVLDQLPLNMFRGTVKSFQSEQQSIEVARYAVENGFVQQLEKERLSFLLMPFMHSEDLADQDLAVKLFTENELEGNIRFAKHHREIIRQFGRFPHRNAILNRESTAAELEYLASDQAFTG